MGREQEIERLTRGLRDVGVASVIGLAGVGKSALGQRFAATWEGRVSRHHAGVGQSAGELLDDVRRSLASEQEGTPELRTDDERLADVAERLDRAGALAVIEDIDRLGAAAPEILDFFGGALRSGRVLATSRTRVEHRADAPDRVEIVLGGLDEEAAGQLWARLDDLYGPRVGFVVAWERTAGNPFYLRRAHAGDLDAENPARAVLVSLDPEQRSLALALALVGQPLAHAVALRLSPGDRARAAVRGLIGRLVIEPTGCGELAIHDLLGHELIAAAGAGEIESGHLAVAEALGGAGLESVLGIRLRVRHLAAAGRFRQARDLLLASASALVRGGGAGELLRGLDMVTCEGDAEARLARARVMARMLDFERAFSEVVSLGADRTDASPQLRASYAHLAMLTLRLDVADHVSREGLFATDIAPDLRIRYATVHVITATYRARGEAARSAVSSFAAGLTSPLARGYAEFSRAFSLWLEERDAEADQAMLAAWGLIHDSFSFRVRVLAPVFKVAVLARAGRTADAAAALREAELIIARFDDPLMRLSLRALRTTLLESEGDFIAAREEAAAVEDAFSRGGYRLGAMWTRLVRVRMTLYSGQVRAGHRLREELMREAVATGAALVVRLAERTAGADPWAAVTGPPPDDSTRPGAQRRERVVTVLRSLGAGEVAVARGYLASIDRAALDELERALLEIAEWGLSAGADPAEDDPRVRLACDRAARAGADPELVPAIVGWLRDRLTGKPGPAMHAIVVDRRSATVQGGGVVVELARRPALRRLLYAMIDAPERACDRQALARAVWGVDYQSIHDGALWVNIKRLRALVGADRAPARVG